MEGYFMTIINDDRYLANTYSNPDKNTFLKKELNFSGTIMYHDLQGNMTNVVLTKKKIQLNKTASTSRFSSKGKISAAYLDHCTETAIYEVIGVNCYDIGSYYTFCQSIYSIYVGHTICGNGGGSGPGATALEVVVVQVVAQLQARLVVGELQIMLTTCASLQV